MSATQKTSETQVPPLSICTKLAYGFGSVAYGVKNNGFDYFLVLFFGQVIGVNQAVVGAAILTALVFDAFSDPIVGYWSDNFRSKWGRRHPFMYAALIPVPLSYYFLWSPPEGWSDLAMYGYIAGLAIIIRTFVTFYETPSSAMAPELAEDYDERSSLISYRYYFGWTGGNLMTLIMFFLIAPAFATEAQPDGTLSAATYQIYGLVGAFMIFIAILFSALGTHHRIPYFKPAPPKREMTILTIFREIFETIANRNFLALFGGALFAAIASGLSAGLAFIMQGYFWGFDDIQKGILALAVFGSAVIGALIAPFASKTIGKKRGAIYIGFAAFSLSPLPIFLRLFDMMPPNGSDILFIFMFFHGLIDVGLIIAFQILAASMIADLVEEAELKTGRRSEGVFFSASTFIRKCVQGFGALSAGAVMLFAGIPAGAKPEDLNEAQIWSLGAWYVPSIFTLWMIMLFFISRYKLTREEHEANLQQLAQRRIEQEGLGE